MLIKLNDAMIGSPDLQINLRTARLPKKALRLCDDGPGQTVPLMSGSNRQIIEPSAVPLVTRHHTRDNLAIKQTHQKQVGSHLHLSSNILAGIVPRPEQVALPPQRNNRLLIFRLEWSNLHEQVNLRPKTGILKYKNPFPLVATAQTIHVISDNLGLARHHSKSNVPVIL
jgi:hypothetical protein